MSNKMAIAGPVQVENDSKHRVAFDLMDIITRHEGAAAGKKDRMYFLQLYYECISVVNGNPPQ